MQKFLEKTSDEGLNFVPLNMDTTDLIMLTDASFVSYTTRGANFDTSLCWEMEMAVKMSYIMAPINASELQGR